MNQLTKEPYLNAYQSLTSAWPSFLPELPEESVLEELWIKPLEVKRATDTLSASSALLFEDNIAFGIPGVDAVSILLAADGSGTAIPLEVQIKPDFALRMQDVPLALQFSKELLKPVRKTAGTADGAASWEVDPAAPAVVIEFAEVDFEVNGDGDITLELDVGLTLPPTMISDTGVVIEAQNAALELDATTPPAGQPAGTKGLAIGQASLYLPGELGEVIGPLTLSNAFIGNGGFTGAVATSFPGGLSVDLFGLGFTLSEVAIAFVQNALTASRIAGTVVLPFFDEPVPVEIAINLNGAFTVRLGGDSNGLYLLTKPGLLEFELESLGFLIEEGLFVAQMSGSIRPLVGGLDWPGLRVTELTIDSQGNVHIEGGWLDLRDQFSLDFYGFALEITQFGIGTEDDGSRWIGVSGGLKLVEGLKAGASVKGLRVSWGDDGVGALSFEGVGVEFEVPDVLRFKGEVAYRQLEVNGETVNRFDGALKLELICINLEIDAELVIGSASGPNGNYTFLGIYLGIDLPAGIPLWATGLALYGMAGLFAMNMEPNKRADEPWYGLLPEEGWYKRPEIGVTDLSDKWVNRKDSLAVGAGITIGTLPDNGFTFNGAMLFAIVFPGPILLIEGKANILKERSSLGDDPIFRALVVLDFRAGDFLVGLDVRYKFDDAARLVDIGASAEMYFSFSDPSAWYLYLGQKEPREKRIRAKILSIWEANSYYMLDNESLAFGAWVGYDADWRFGPVRVELEAWMETNVKVSWSPAHFYGNLWAHGKIDIRVFGFGLGLSLDAYLEGDVFDPFHILAQLQAGINLPWPLPDFSVEITLEWGPEPEWPLPPLPVKEVAIEHLKVGTAWALPRDMDLLVPNYLGSDGLRANWETAFHADFDDSAPPPPAAPVVPLDCRPRITFARSVHDKALVGNNVTPPSPARERIGDPEADEGPVNVKYELIEVVLASWDGSDWASVAQKGETDDASVERLYGSWAPIPPIPDTGGPAQGQTKLWLWSKNPFDYTRRSGREWEDWISGRYPNMPCVSPPEQTLLCWDFSDIDLGPLLTGEIPGLRWRWWKHPDEQGPVFIWGDPDFPEVRVISPTNTLINRGFCLPSIGFDGVFGDRNALFIFFEDIPNRGATIHCWDPEGVTAYAFSDTGGLVAIGGLAPEFQVDINLDNLRSMMLTWNSRLCLWRVCLKQGASQAEIDEALVIAQHNVQELERWQSIGEVLQPHTQYRLRIRTRIDADASSPLSGDRIVEQEEFAFFQTEGAPGLVNLSIPLTAPEPDEISLRNGQGDFVLVDGTPAGENRALSSELNDLTLYVTQTLPPTVPLPGRNRPLPRPVYRAYDVAVIFNEDYVSQLYRMSGRDLSLYLFDSNNQPVRDAAGRLITIRSRWDIASDLVLDHHETTWVETVNQSSCGSIDTLQIPHDETLTTRGLVLQPDFVHQARLTPLLLHEFFQLEVAVGDQASGTGARLGRWQVQDDGSIAGPSIWRVEEAGVPPSRFVRQLSNLHSLPADGLFPAKNGTILALASRDDLPADHPEQPANWTDYRVTVTMRNADDDAIGLVFRRANASRYYRFSMDRARSYRRLTRHLDSAVLVLAEDDFTYRSDQDYTVVVEAIGAELSVYLDSELVFRVSDETYPQGGIGLYCWASVEARFADIRVDDFRNRARPAYLFDFTTSLYAHFLHQVHSFEDEIWQSALEAADMTAIRNVAVDITTPLSEEESRHWTAVSQRPALASLLAQAPTETEITALEVDGEIAALLLRCPEPFDPARVSLTLERSEEPRPKAEKPAALKLVGITRSASDPNAESIALLVRQSLNPNGKVIEQRILPGPLVPAPLTPCLMEENFARLAGVLFEEKFGDAALDLYEQMHWGSPAPNWTVASSRIEQVANTFDGAFSSGNLAKQGTMALFGAPSWANIRFCATLNSGDDDSIGLVVRYQRVNNGAESYIRFEMNRQFGYCRLVRMSGGEPTLLWSNDFVFEADLDYKIELLAYRRRLVCFVNGVHFFDLTDSEAPLRGRVGLWCWANTAARFADIRVDSLSADPLIDSPAFDTLDGWEVLDAPGSIQGPSDWQAVDGGVVQRSNIHVVSSGPDYFGTMLVGGRILDDVIATITITTADNDGVGLAIRVAAPDTYYRFSMSSQQNYRRLVKVVNGTVTTLWQDNAGYPPGATTYSITLQATGPVIEVWLAGVRLATVEDDEIVTGRVGLYSWASQNVRFDSLRIFDGARRVGQWQIVDTGMIGAPSIWSMRPSQLLQSANIYGGLTNASSPVKPGTMAIAGQPIWQDYRLVVDLSSDDDDAIGVVVRYVDPQNYYYFAIDAQRDYRRFVRVEGNIFTTLWSGTGGYVPGDRNRITVDAIGNRFTGYMGNTSLFSLTDDAHAAGRIGLYAWANTKARFHRVEVCTPPQVARALQFDDFRGPGLGDWTIVDAGNASAPSNWTVSGSALRQDSNIHSTPFTATNLDKEGTYALSGDPSWNNIILEVDLTAEDNDAMGVMFRVRDNDNYYRFLMDRQRNVCQLVAKIEGTFTLLWEHRAGYDLERHYRLTIVADGPRLIGYLAGILMFDVQDPNHVTGQVALFAWAMAGVRFQRFRVYPIELATPFELDEDFAVFRSFRWRFEDDGSATNPPGFAVEEGALVRVATSDTVSAATVAVAGTEANWSDYRASTVLRTGAPGEVGLEVRRSEAGLYRFTVNLNNTRRLVRVSGNTETELWRDSSPISANVDLALSIDCVGARITLYFNGNRLTSIIDPSGPSSGGIGLYAGGNANVSFQIARVGLPTWSPIYRFTNEERMADGTRIRIRSGSAVEPFTPEPLEENRFITDPFFAGELRLGTDEVDLRIEGMEGIEHQQRFLNDTSFTAVGLSRLSKADGTAMILLADSDAMVRGAYRLRAQFRRNISSVDPLAPVLSEDNETDDEIATINFSL